MTHAEILKIAKQKAATLQNKQQIRVTPDASINYWVYNFDNVRYIGYELTEPMQKFFPREEYTMSNKEGKTVAKLQKLL